MKPDFGIAPRIGIFLAGVAAGALASFAKSRWDNETSEIPELKRSIAELEARLAAQETNHASQLRKMETQLQEQGALLVDVPSTKQIVDGVEQLLSRTMSSLDERLTVQAHSIDVLRTTVSQTDGLLERVLESLDSLQTSDSPELIEAPLIQRPAV